MGGSYDGRYCLIQGLDCDPERAAQKIQLAGRARVAIVDYGGVLSIVPAMTDPVAEAAGMLKGERSLTGALLAERAQERARER